MMQQAAKNHELVSALADGQLSGEEFALAVGWVGSAQDARLSWHAYHLVGDVLRSGEAMAGAQDAAFVSRLKLCLQQEAPYARSVTATGSNTDCKISTPDGGIERSNRGSANDSHFRWKLLAGMASLAAVSVLSWQFLSNWNQQRGASQLVQAQQQSGEPAVALRRTTAAASGEPQVMMRDPQLDALLAAHRQLGGTSALQMPAGFLRNATFEGVPR
jgi:sigma-E factor negative regulatory protein RseA